ncbi:related to HEM14 - Protoporphyrinogen oxidase involved in heme biosynthetic pathway [Melanopsichium pennsylvanicum]|uniref:Protoporphyrinogen oxidase n=2 Tax=Melanopsichium pennsylvanicum TaxID=63383 RepID=A0AAJ4XPV4_9BASI|nr:protoporphyrinogen oxidase [Melanopsichium pennsylvanicum 4]SNX86212.1 related to HEM14 - Protoporphyrinogen oxidase involved in heme biosynthetic pathway [Melanopsichium pennsylvanicum]
MRASTLQVKRSLTTSARTPANDKKRIAVIGGGISGLTSAYRLASQLPKDRYDIVLLEHQQRLGGWIQSERINLPSTTDGATALIEKGPRSIRPAGLAGLVMLELVRSLGLLERMLKVPKTAPSAKNRYLYYPDKLVKLPSSISSLLFALVKLPFLRSIVPGVLGEARVPSRFQRPKSESSSEKARLQQRELIEDESVDSFVSRRFGKGLAENLVSAVIHGIYAGDTRKLSVRAVLPYLWEAERVHGGILRSMLPAKRNKRHRPLPDAEAAVKAAKQDRLKAIEKELGKDMLDSFKEISVYSFPNGVQEIVQALEARLAESQNVAVQKGDGVTSIIADNSGKVLLRTGKGETIEADRIISSIPSSQLADILPEDIELLHLKHNPSANVGVVNIAIPPNVVSGYKHIVPVQGFGYLIPRTTPGNQDGILGVVFDSDAIPDQDSSNASQRPVKLTVMMGGSHWSSLSTLPSEQDMKDRAIMAVSTHLGIDSSLLQDSSKVAVKATLQKECIPWYTVGHPVRMAKLHEALMKDAILANKLTLVGASYTGVSLNDCVAYATEAVEQIVAAELEGEDSIVTGLRSFAIPPVAPKQVKSTTKVNVNAGNTRPSTAPQGLMGPTTTQFALVRGIHTQMRALSTSRPRSHDCKSTSDPISLHDPASEEKKSTKSLNDILLDSIRASGPMAVSTYMRTCLLDPMQGYYSSANSPSTSREVLGSRGDFITSPEISQVFGELVAIFYLARWQSVGAPGATRIVELGPGKGTLLADMLRTFATFKPFMATLKRIQLVETSEGLMELQLSAIRDALAVAGKTVISAEEESTTPNGVVVEWFPSIDMVPVHAEEFTILTAHEFFDALPTHIFEKGADGKFREVLVGIKPKSAITVLKPGDTAESVKLREKEELGFVLSPTPTPWAQMLAQNNPRFTHLKPGQRVEISPESWAVARRVGELIAGRPAAPPSSLSKIAQTTAAVGSAEAEAEAQLERERLETITKTEQARLSIVSQGGIGLIIDYGDDKAFGNSFRAFRHHQLVPVFESPGNVDLTVNVDFLHIKSALATTDVRYLGPLDQADFLVGMGLQMRTERLIKGKSEQDEKRIKDAANRLVDETGMGVQYKALAIVAAPTTGGSGDNINNHKSNQAPERNNDVDPDVYPFEFQQ